MSAASKTAVNVVFGCMTIGASGQEQSRVHDLKNCQQILTIFHQHGHDELDTARMYGSGTSEEYLNKLEVEKQGFRVATKNYPSARGAGAKGWKTYTHSAEDV